MTALLSAECMNAAEGRGCNVAAVMFGERGGGLHPSVALGRNRIRWRLWGIPLAGVSMRQFAEKRWM